MPHSYGTPGGTGADTPGDLSKQQLAHTPVVLYLLVYVSLLWDKTHQGWHDKAAGTVVIRV